MSTIDSKEQLSQLMDGEIDGEPGRFLLRRLEASGELRSTWARYHLIRDCMRFQDRAFADDELSARVRRAIDGHEEAGASATVASGGRSWFRPAAGFAVAAAVAMMAVVAVAPNLPNGAPATETAALEASTPFASPNILARGPESRQVNLSGGQVDSGADKLNSYLLRHYQVAGASAGNGFVSFVPIVVSKPAVQQSAPAEAVARQENQQESESLRQ